MGAGGRIETVFRSCTEDTILATREDYGLTEPTPPEVGRPSWAMLSLARRPSLSIGFPVGSGNAIHWNSHSERRGPVGA
jgi:hypothetical protein